MRRGASGLRWRVTVAAVVVVGLALVAGGTLLVSVYRTALTNDVATATRLLARDVAVSVRDGTVADSVADAGGRDSLAQVLDARGAVVAASANLGDSGPLLHLRSGVATRATRLDLPGTDVPFSVVARRVVTPDGAFVVIAGRGLESVDDSTAHLLVLLLIGFPLVLALVAATTWTVVGRALQPVEAIRREVESITATDLHRRVPVPAGDDEVGRLARTMNGMLERIEDAVVRQRRFVADASHELRSPLTGIRAQLEVDLAHPELADWQATERDVLDDAVRLQRLVDDLLTLAATSGAAPLATRVEPVDVDEIVFREVRRVRSRSDHVIDASAVSGGQVLGDADALGRAVRNLLDNADRHARSRVTVGVDETPDAVVVWVEDDGAGVPESEREQVFEPFTRGDEGRARDDGGAGLGLAIARATVTAQGGTLTVGAGADGTGARFTIRLPQAI